MEQLMELMMERRSVRNFKDTPIPRQTLEQIVEAGRWAPTAGNCQTVHFTVITNPEVLEDLRCRVYDAFRGMELQEGQYISIRHSILQAQRGSYVYDYHAPALVVVSNQRDYPNALADSACALQNMMLMAEALEVGGCWINQLHWLEDHPLVRSGLCAVGIGQGETVCGALALGYYDAKPMRRPRIGMQVDYVD